jgi:hypothetical protein
MPQLCAASVRRRPSGASANACILREAFVSVIRDASRRSSGVDRSVHVTSTAMPILLVSHTEWMDIALS